jgi:hypothetical protein
MKRTIGSKTVRCPACGWVGQDVELKSMAGFVFCPRCNHRQVAYFPIVDPENPQGLPTPDAADAACPECATWFALGMDCPLCNRKSPRG